jgi:hypothetical protein
MCHLGTVLNDLISEYILSVRLNGITAELPIPHKQGITREPSGSNK